MDSPQGSSDIYWEGVGDWEGDDGGGEPPWPCPIPRPPRPRPARPLPGGRPLGLPRWTGEDGGVDCTRPARPLLGGRPLGLPCWTGADDEWSTTANGSATTSGSMTASGKATETGRAAATAANHHVYGRHGPCRVGAPLGLPRWTRADGGADRAQARKHRCPD
jgi:hypothetical protein